MVVVVAMIALMSILVIPKVSSYFQISLNSASREMATAVKEAYNSTILTGRVFRMVYDIKANSYWVESGPSTALLDTAESKEKEERRKRFFKTEGKEEEHSAFSLDKSIMRKKKDLPRGVVYEDVVTQQNPDPITEGTAYTHFFPHGVTEQTTIHLTDSSHHHATLVISALVGRTDVYDRYVPQKELLEQK